MLLSEGVRFTAESFAHFEGVVIISLRLGDSNFTLLNTLLKLLHFEVDSSQVSVESQFQSVKSNSFTVKSNSLFEVAGFVGSITFKFLGFCIFFTLNLSSVFGRHFSLFPRFLFSFSVNAHFFCSSFSNFSSVLVLVFGSHFILLHLVHVNTSQFLEDSVIAWVSLHHLDQHLWVLNTHFVTSRELRVGEHLSELGKSFHSLEIGGRHGVPVITTHGASSSHSGHIKTRSSTGTHSRVLHAHLVSNALRESVLKDTIVGLDIISLFE